MSDAVNSNAVDDGVREVNFDGLVSPPPHNYSGLAHGNVASIKSWCLVSNPKEGALQGLLKMKSLMDAGYAQGVLPPQQRPDVGALRDLGFSGSNSDVLNRAAKKEAPQLLRAVCSASSMWTANAGTVPRAVLMHLTAECILHRLTCNPVFIAT